MLGILGSLLQVGGGLLGSLNQGPNYQKESLQNLSQTMLDAYSVQEQAFGQIKSIAQATQASNIGILQQTNNQAISFLAPYMASYANTAQAYPTSVGYGAQGYKPGTSYNPSPSGTTTGQPGVTPNYPTTPITDPAEIRKQQAIDQANGGPQRSIDEIKRGLPAGSISQGVAVNPNNPSQGTTGGGIYQQQPGGLAGNGTGAAPPPAPVAGPAPTAPDPTKYGLPAGYSGPNEANSYIGDANYSNALYDYQKQTKAYDQTNTAAQADYQKQLDSYYSAPQGPGPLQGPSALDNLNSTALSFQHNVDGSVINAPTTAPGQSGLVDWNTIRNTLDQATNFNVQQGTQEVQNSAAAKGMLNSGNTMAAISDRAQGTAASFEFPYLTQMLAGQNQNILAQNTINANYQNNLNTALSSIYNTNTSAASQAVTQRYQIGSAAALGAAQLASGLGTSIAGENTNASNTIANATLADANARSSEMIGNAQLNQQAAKQGFSLLD